MSTKVCIIGNKGNMGRRYAACLDYLNIDHFGIDKEWPPECFDFGDTTHIVIATPTDTHCDIINKIRDVYEWIGPILCEKPIAKDLQKLLAVDFENLYMVNNYQYIANAWADYSGVSYNYYHSGNDGLAWDCIQLFKFGEPQLSNKSPVWECFIKDKKVSKDQIDQSYIDMLKDFTGPMEHVWGKDIIIDLHLKVAKYEIENSHRDSSPN